MGRFSVARGRRAAAVPSLGRKIGNQAHVFNTSVEKFLEAVEDLELDLLVIVQKLVLELFSEIIDRTPVDTGRARAAWTITVDGGSIDATPKSGQKVYVIANGVPYIVFLEFGSSSQAPEGIVRISLLRFGKQVRDIARKITSGR